MSYFVSLRKVIVLLSCVMFLSHANISRADTSEHVRQAKIFLAETLKILNTGNKTNKEKRQIIVNRYIPNINFEWNAKSALGRPYLQLSKEEQQEYIREYTKFLIYSWLPKLNYDTKIGIQMKILDKSIKINDTDETITLVILMNDGTKYEAFLRTRIEKNTNQFKILNIVVEGIDLAASYRAQFSGYIEQNKNDPRSIIQYLKKQNAEKQKIVDFSIPKEFQ